MLGAIGDLVQDVVVWRREDLREDWVDEYGAVGTYVQDARDSKITLFI